MTALKRGLLVAFAAAWCACPAARAEELVNPSFEEPETETDNEWGDLAAGWRRWGNWMNRESQWVPTRSGNCLMGYHHWRIEENNPSGFFQDVPGIPDGTLCQFSIFVFRDDQTDADSVELRLERLGGFETLASQVFYMDDIRRKAWGILTVSGRTKGEGVRVLVIVTPKQAGGRQGAIKFDDAELLLDPTAEPKEPAEEPAKK